MATVENPLVGVRELSSHLGDPKLVVVDCRFDLSKPEAGYLAYQTGHIPGAVHANLDRDLSAPVIPGVTGRHPLPNPEALARTLGTWGISNDSLVVAYDDAGGAIAARLWWLLYWLGHERAAVLDGGIAAWKASGGALEATSPSPARRIFVPHVRAHLVADVDEVSAAVASGNPPLLDARAAPRFRGDEEPIDRVPGHIPGARSLPFMTLLDAGHFKESEQVRAVFETTLRGAPAESAIGYCGSGVTACHLLLGAVHAGLPMPRLYAGSYSEWIANEARPVERS